jgi:hypothetical protein
LTVIKYLDCLCETGENGKNWAKFVLIAGYLGFSVPFPLKMTIF